MIVYQRIQVACGARTWSLTWRRSGAQLQVVRWWKKPRPPKSLTGVAEKAIIESESIKQTILKYLHVCLKQYSSWNGPNVCFSVSCNTPQYTLLWSIMCLHSGSHYVLNFGRFWSVFWWSLKAFEAFDHLLVATESCPGAAARGLQMAV